MSSFLESGAFSDPFIRAPYYIWDLKRDLNLENYPYGDLYGLKGFQGFGSGICG